MPSTTARIGECGRIAGVDRFSEAYGEELWVCSETDPVCDRVDLQRVGPGEVEATLDYPVAEVRAARSFGGTADLTCAGGNEMDTGAGIQHFFELAWVDIEGIDWAAR